MSGPVLDAMSYAFFCAFKVIPMLSKTVLRPSS
jgi:hypothetical protein